MSVATHILFATDFSEAAEEAAIKSHELVSALGVPLTILYVHHHPPAAPEAVVPANKVVTSVDLEQESLALLDELKKKMFADLSSVDVATVEHGSAPLAICDYAAKHDVDLIVMGTHGRTGLGRILIGSVAEKVVRHSSCPVLVVPHHKGLEVRAAK